MDKKPVISEEVKCEIALELFGTRDYKKVLEVISPSSEMMREFERRLRKEMTNGN